EQETLLYSYSTGWIPYDTVYCWYLLEGEGANTVYVQYTVGGIGESAIYADSIILDRIIPTGSLVINNDDKFTNNSSVIITNTMSDERSGMAKMYYDNECLKNVLKNSGFDNTSYCDAIQIFTF
ncbi:unnamed protein product, partial [marine sediment metagenome]